MLNDKGVDEEKRRRIQVALWAYAYEIMADPIVSDDIFDAACYLINLDTLTNSPEMDVWFKENFEPFTGQWIHSYPNLARLHQMYCRHKGLDESLSIREILNGN